MKCLNNECYGKGFSVNYCTYYRIKVVLKNYLDCIDKQKNIDKVFILIKFFDIIESHGKTLMLNRFQVLHVFEFRLVGETI